jgi:hypothetical protein
MDGRNRTPRSERHRDCRSCPDSRSGSGRPLRPFDRRDLPSRTAHSAFCPPHWNLGRRGPCRSNAAHGGADSRRREDQSRRFRIDNSGSLEATEEQVQRVFATFASANSELHTVVQLRVAWWRGAPPERGRAHVTHEPLITEPFQAECFSSRSRLGMISHCNSELTALSTMAPRKAASKPRTWNPRTKRRPPPPA